MENNKEEYQYQSIENKDFDKVHDRNYIINKYNIPSEHYTYTRKLEGDKWYNGIIYKIFCK